MTPVAVANKVILEVTGVDVTAFGIFTITSTMDSKVFVDGDDVFIDKITGTVASITLSGGYTVPITLFEIKGTSNKTTAVEKKLVLEGDESDEIEVTGVLSGSPPKTSKVKVRVKGSGQTIFTVD